MFTARKELFESLKNPGGGNNMHSVLEGLGPRRICISSLNLAK